jgi:hypothetical protein
MKFLFDNESFSFETLRTAGFAVYGGADLGEVLATASHIGEGDEASWHQAWKATAQRVAEIGEQALASGHRVSAREALLRASNYYRTASAFLLEQPATDPEMTLLSAGQCDTFAAAAALFDTPVWAVSIPYEDTTLPRTCFSSTTPARRAPPSSTTADPTPPARSPTSPSPPPRWAADTTSLAFDGPGREVASSASRAR